MNDYCRLNPVKRIKELGGGGREESWTTQRFQKLTDARVKEWNVGPLGRFLQLMVNSNVLILIEYEDIIISPKI